METFGSVNDLGEESDENLQIVKERIEQLSLGADLKDQQKLQQVWTALEEERWERAITLLDQTSLPQLQIDILKVLIWGLS